MEQTRLSGLKAQPLWRGLILAAVTFVAAFAFASINYSFMGGSPAVYIIISTAYIGVMMVIFGDHMLRASDWQLTTTLTRREVEFAVRRYEIWKIGNSQRGSVKSPNRKKQPWEDDGTAAADPVPAAAPPPTTTAQGETVSTKQQAEHDVATLSRMIRDAVVLESKPPVPEEPASGNPSANGSEEVGKALMDDPRIGRAIEEEILRRAKAEKKRRWAE